MFLSAILLWCRFCWSHGQEIKDLAVVKERSVVESAWRLWTECLVKMECMSDALLCNNICEYNAFIETNKKISYGGIDVA